MNARLHVLRQSLVTLAVLGVRLQKFARAR